MGLIRISETQLAFGYFHSYMNVYKPKKFMLPSIRQEGGQVKFDYPGADIILNSNHLIQFKRPFYFTTNGIKEFWNYSKPPDIDPPYFRFYIKNDSPTNQLSQLIGATQKGLKAEYISPLFEDENTFFSLLKNDRSHIQEYAHIDIAQFKSDLGAIGKNNNHTIIYNSKSVSSGFCYCFSEPKRIVAGRFDEVSTDERQEQGFNANEMIEIIRSTFFPDEEIPLQSENALLQCGYLQNRLLIQRNIIWTFNYTIIK